jgi:hypothetical protein
MPELGAPNIFNELAQFFAQSSENLVLILDGL